MRTTARGASAALVVLAASCLLVSTATAGGGSPWEFDRPFYEPGDRVNALADASAGFDESALADGPYGVWIASYDPLRESPGTLAERIERARYVADVRVEVVPREFNGEPYDGHIAHVEFTLPALAPGVYEVLHCNYPCTRTLGSLSYGFFWVGPPDATSDVRTVVHEPEFAGPAVSPPTTTTTSVPATTPTSRVTVRPASARRQSPTPSQDADGNTLPIVAGAAALALAAGTVAVARKRHAGDT